MVHLMHFLEWQGASGVWYCGDTSDLGKGSGYWWLPARMLGITPAAYVEKIIKEFNPIVYHNEDCSFVSFSWKSQSDMRRFKNWLNAEARSRNFMI